MKRHYGMTELSDREKKFIAQLLNDAMKEGGTPLRLVMKKLILVTYWTHMTLWAYFDPFDTVYNTLSRIFPPKDDETIEEAIKREIYGIYPWEKLGDNPEYYSPIYRKLTSEVILSKDINSMRYFEMELNKAIEDNQESTKAFINSSLGTNSIRRTPAIDTPF